ncbi:unnamed protein product [Caenorhabditis angaria]|uniref:Uncharacterized protein n=1 Tax=Caenorhabditis angaria TaxID=860376 RepID=A0A9P1J4L2_9PELO|nr:unnamed protein product [Caenorhabditis angaria]
MIRFTILVILLICFNFIYSHKNAWLPQHWYGGNSETIRSGVVQEWNPPPVMNIGTVAPHICGFNTFTRRCMDPEGFCPGRCMNFRYTYNTLYDCRCLAI